MIESKNHAVSGCSQMSMGSVRGEECKPLLHRTPLKLTLSVQKIDHVLADIQKQIEDLQRDMTNLRLVRTQLAVYERAMRKDERRTPYIHAALIDLQGAELTAG